MFGFDRLRQAMRVDDAGSELLDRLLEELRDFVGADHEQEDDITLVTLRRSAGVAEEGAVAERIREGIAGSPLSIEDGAPEEVAVTTSIGVATLPSPGIEDLDALVKSADASLYRAKERGRNRVEHEGSPS